MEISRLIAQPLLEPLKGSVLREVREGADLDVVAARVVSRFIAMAKPAMAVFAFV